MTGTSLHFFCSEHSGGSASGTELMTTLAFLRRSLHPDRVIETHSAFIMLAGHRAYKLKKPVKLDAFDHRSLPAREAACREELRLNRELAGRRIYLGLVPITSSGESSLQLGGSGRLVDWLLVMRRLPAQRMLDAVLKRGSRPTPEEVAAVADVLIRFYGRHGARVGDVGPYLAHLQQETATNRAVLQKHQQTLADTETERLLSSAEKLIGSALPAIASRAAKGLLIEGHGDLRAEHVCLTHPPIIFDRVEFSLSLRLIDIGEEINTLGLECRMLGAPEIGPAITERLSAAGYAPLTCALLRYYTLFRCLTRARLCIQHLDETPPRTPEIWPARAVAYLVEAERVLTGPLGTWDELRH